MVKYRVVRFVCVAIAFLSFSLNASAEEPYYYSILAEAMNPLDSTIGFDCRQGYLKTTTNATSHPSDAWYIAQINLPQGAEILSVKCYGYDTAGTENLSFGIYRYRFKDVASFAPEEVTEIIETSDTPGFAELTALALVPIPGTPAFGIVDNQEYSYGLYLDLPAATSGELYAVRFLVEAELANQTTKTRTVVVPLM